MECPICAYKYTDKIRNDIECLFCNEKCCKQCVKNYLLSISNDFHCLYCKNTWSTEFLLNNLPQTFICNELKVHRQHILFDRERSLLPITQEAVKVELKKRYREQKRKELVVVRNKLKQELDAINKEINDLDRRTGSYELRSDNYKDQKFIRGCPANECRGYLSTKWICGLCAVKVCSDCHEIEYDEHVCKPENIESAKLIKKDSKPCPKCASLIFKLSGCNQMFCTSCKVSFDWVTGDICTINIHNPHYFEYLRTHNMDIIPRTNGDEECGGLPNIYTFTANMRSIVSYNQQEIFTNIYRCINHIRFVILRNLPIDNIIINNENLRVQYLLKDIDDAKFKKILQEREKERDKNREIRNIFNMFVNIASDKIREVHKIISETFRNSITTNKNIVVEIINNKLDITEELLKILKIIFELREYTNNALIDVSKKFKCVISTIDNNYEIIKYKKSPKVINRTYEDTSSDTNDLFINLDSD